jgi:hypothetical protein
MQQGRRPPKTMSQETHAMHYKTITLALIQDQYPALHERLRASRTLLTELDLHAAALKRYHQTRTEELTLARPGSEEMQIASAALELAIEDLRDDLRLESPTDDSPAAALSLDAAMNYVRRHTPPA